MKDTKFLIYGALVVLAIPITLSLIAANKKKNSSSNSFSMDGYSNLAGVTRGWCRMRNSDGSYSYDTVGDNGRCSRGWTQVSTYGER